MDNKLNKKDVDVLLDMINKTNFQGTAIEYLFELKSKLKSMSDEMNTGCDERCDSNEE